MPGPWVAGRFVSDDEVTDTDNPEQLNGYAYANNSPVTQFDSTGLSSIKVDGLVCASELHTVAGRKKLAKATKAQVKYQKALGEGARKVAKQLKAEAKARAIFKKFFGGAGHTATAVGAGTDFATGTTDARAKASSQLRRGLSKGGKSMRWLRDHPTVSKIGEIGKNPAIKATGKALIIIGPILDIIGNLADGDDGATAVMKAVLPTALSIAGGYFGAGLGGACEPAAAVCSPLFGAAGGWLGGVAGEYANDQLGKFGVWKETASWFDWD